MLTQPTPKIVSISTSTVIKTIGILLGVSLLYFIRNLALLLFLTYVIASGLNPLIVWSQKKFNLSRNLASLLVLVTLFGGIGVLIFVALQDMVTQSLDLADQLPVLLNDLVNNLGLKTYLEVDTNEDVFAKLGENFNINSLGGTIGGTLLSYGSSLFSGVITFITLASVTFYQLTKPHKIKNFIVSLSPDSSKTRISQIVDKVEYKLGRWLIGQLTLVFGLGLFSFIGFSLFGIDYALPLAILAGLSDIVPIIGPVFAIVPLVIVAFTTLPLPLAIGVVAYFVVLQQIEGNIIVPKIMNSTVGIDSIVVIVSIMIGSAIAGGLGALLAIPISVICTILYEEWQTSRAN
jgi:predicted PurR-regulated permease PerM